MRINKGAGGAAIGAHQASYNRRVIARTGRGAFVLLLGLVLGAAGCGSPPQADIDLAKTNLEKAAAAGAETLARESMKAARQAQAALEAELKGQEGKWFKSYAKALDLAVAVQAAGDKAAADATAARSRIMAAGANDGAPSGPNLFKNGDFSEALTGWARVPAPWVSVRVEPANGHAELRVRVDTDGQHVAVLQGITVQPDTPYVYEMEVKSTGRVAALYWASDVARFESEKSFPEWTKRRYVFITPHWDGKPRYSDFHPVLPETAGDIWVRNIRLAELKIN